MNTRSLHIIYVADDGITSLRCGVGAIARNFIVSFPEIAKQCRTTLLELRLSVISIEHPTDSTGYRSDFMQETRLMCRRYDGDLHLIASLVTPQEDYFQFDRWIQYNKTARGIVDVITERDGGDVLVIANDTIFGYTYSTNPSVKNLWIPHSLSQVHKQSYVDGDERNNWEWAIFSRVQESKHSYIGYISTHVQGLINASYNVNPNKLIPMRNGFFLPDLKQSRNANQDELRCKLKARGIPTDKKLILSFGRADEYKGLDISLLAMQKITRVYPEYHGVVIASRFSGEAFIGDLQLRLLQILEEEKNHIDLFLGYEFELPKYVLAYKNTKFLLNFPTRDFCPLVPYESQIIAGERLIVMNSDLPCFQGLFSNECEGFLCQPAVDDVVQCFCRIQSMSSEALGEIASRGERHAQTNFNIVHNYVAGIKELLRK